MKVVAVLTLLPTPDQHAALLATLERSNACCNWLSEQAWQTRTFQQFRLHRLSCHEARARFSLTAQMAVRCIAKVADAYKLNHTTKRAFRARGSIAYDDRILRVTGPDHVNLWTLTGRQSIAFVCGERQRALLDYRKGKVDPSYVARTRTLYLSAVCEVDEPSEAAVTDYLGVDLGIVNLAVDSDGTVYSGEAVEQRRRTYVYRRRNLQRKGTRAAKRKLRQLSGRKSRSQRDVNHRISKRLVATAQRTDRGLALEDLTHIRERVTARRRQRARISNWSYFQLRSFIAYKARLAGVPVVLVDPRFTSQTCPACGFAGAADTVAAGNIRSRARAAVNQPMVAASR